LGNITIQHATPHIIVQREREREREKKKHYISKPPGN
jgi:hypothetical protein